MPQPRACLSSPRSANRKGSSQPDLGSNPDSVSQLCGSGHVTQLKQMAKRRPLLSPSLFFVIISPLFLSPPLPLLPPSPILLIIPSAYTEFYVIGVIQFIQLFRVGFF